ncbi:ATP-binding cassette sub-family G member 2 [Chlorella vulgaris]
MTQHVAIVGGGVIGAATAFYLSKQGARCTVLEATGPACSASGKAGGFLALDWNDSSPIGPLARRSYALHAELAQELGAESTGYRPVNTHSISVRQGQAGPASSSGASKRLPSLPGWVARDHISQASVIGTHENTAQVHPELFTNALLQRMQEAGGSVQIAAVTGLVTENDRVTAVKARDSISGEDRILQADAVVFACGAWSSKLQAWLPQLPDISGLKVHSIVVADPQQRTTGDALFLAYRGSNGKSLEPEVYPRPGGQVYICGVSEDDVPVPATAADVHVRADAIAQLQGIAASVSQELGTAEVLKEQACYLPCSDDGLPVIGKVPGLDNAYVATGHSCWGILNAPATGEALAELILQGGAAVLLAVAGKLPANAAAMGSTAAFCRPLAIHCWPPNCCRLRGPPTASMGRKAGSGAGSASQHKRTHSGQHARRQEDHTFSRQRMRAVQMARGGAVQQQQHTPFSLTRSPSDCSTSAIARNRGYAAVTLSSNSREEEVRRCMAAQQGTDACETKAGSAHLLCHCVNQRSKQAHWIEHAPCSQLGATPAASARCRSRRAKWLSAAGAGSSPSGSQATEAGTSAANPGPSRAMADKATGRSGGVAGPAVAAAASKGAATLQKGAIAPNSGPGATRWMERSIRFAEHRPGQSRASTSSSSVPTVTSLACNRHAANQCKHWLAYLKIPFTELQRSAQKVPGNLQARVLGGSGEAAAFGFAAPAASAGPAGASVSLFDGVETVIRLKPHKISSETSLTTAVHASTALATRSMSPPPSSEPTFAQLSLRRLQRSVGERVIISNLSFSLSSGETLFITGPSGVGKSLLLRTLAYLDPFDSGELKLAGKTPIEWGVPNWRALVTYSRVQHKGTPAELYFTLQQFRSQRGRPRGDLPALVHQLGLEQAVLNQPWSELSGGQAQRLQLAIAIALRPLVLLLDEPTSALDTESTRRVEAVLKGCGAALIWVSHDPGQPGRVGGRVLTLPLGNDLAHQPQPSTHPPRQRSRGEAAGDSDRGDTVVQHTEMAALGGAEAQLAALFGDMYAAVGWRPQRQLLAELLTNATAILGSGGSSGGAAASSSGAGCWDAADIAAALLTSAGMPTDGGAADGGIVGSKGGGGPGDSGPVDISWVGLVLGTLLIAINGLISVWLRLGLHGKLAVAAVRCILQLSVLGYILLPIFTFNRWWLTLLYTLFMLVVAAVEAVSRPTQTYNGMLLQVLTVLGLASSAIISYGLALVVRVSPWYDPQYLIPMLGMLLGNACSGVAVGLSTILDELSSGRDKVEMLLAMGATRMEATRDVVQRASRMALTPLLNTMNVVGIVSIPGMMTGQILGGSDPSKAARYQIIIMFLIGAATGMAAVATIMMAVLSLLDSQHRLRPERLVPSASGKGALAWLGAQAAQGWRAMRSRATHIAARVRRAFGGDHGRKRGAAAYRPLDGGGGAGNGSRGGRVGGAGTADTEAEAEGPEQLPPRLREVLLTDQAASSSASSRATMASAACTSRVAVLLLLLASAIAQQNVTCPAGFTGPSCALCQTTAACSASTGDAAATCSSDLAFNGGTQLKSFACSLPADGLLGSLLEPGSLLIQCSPSAANCSIGFGVTSPRVAVKCAATDCSFVAGQSSLTCASTACSCPADATCGNNSLIASLAGSVSGQASLDCNTTGGCVLKMEGLPVDQIDATCQAAQCITPGESAQAPAQAASPPASPKPRPPPRPSPPPAPSAEVSGDGTCAVGWEGNGCALCKSNFACMTGENGGVGNTAASCSRNLTFASNSQLKSYSCELKGGGLVADLIQPGTLLVQCHTGLQAGEELGGNASASASPTPAPEAAPGPSTEPESPPPPPAPVPAASPSPPPPPQVTIPGAIQEIIGAVGGGDAAPPGAAPAPGPEAAGTGGRRRALLQASEERRCEIGFRVKNPDVAIKCVATGCIMNPGTSKVQCEKTACSCPDTPGCGSTTIQGLIGSATGQAKLDCDAAGTCAIILQGLPISQLDATCQAGECLVPTTSSLNTTEVTSGTSLNTNPIIAAVPLMVLLLVTLAAGTYTYSQRSMWGYRISPGDLAQLEALAAKPQLASRRVGVLTFDNLTVSVPQRPKEAAKKAEALRRKAMQSQAAARQGRALGGEQGSGTLSRIISSARTKLHVPAAFGGSGSGDVERAGSGGSSHMERAASAEDAGAADFVVGLHQLPAHPDRWHILRGCSGSVHGGQVVGLLGPSGCGKTTLLGSIAGSAAELGSGTTLTGSVLVDGARRRKSEVAYVPQSDVLIPSLTVQECLRYSALLRLPQDTSPLDLQVHVERVLDELGLRHIADNQVGGAGGIRGVSGGERRRVTIGMELVIDPSILVLDEPTSGLDSYTADNLMHALKAVAARGRVVVASLHQPSRDVFHSLDQVVLMGHGRMLYMGAPSDAEAWFEQRGLPCPPGTAIAEHMLKVASDAAAIRHLLQTLELEGATDQHGSPQPPKHSSSRTSLLATAAVGGGGGSVGGGDSDEGEEEGGKLGSSLLDRSPFEGAAAGVPLAPGLSKQPSSGSGSELAAPLASPGAGGGAAPRGRRKAAFGRQLSVMFWRSFVDIVRNPALLVLHSVVALVMGLMTGLVFLDSDLTNTGVQNRMGGTFFALAFLAFTSLTTVDLLINERQVVTREVRGGYYEPTAYLLAKLTLDAMLLRVLPAIWYFLTFYYLAGFQTGAAYAAAYCFILITFSCVVGAMSMCITVVSNTAGQASFAMNFTLLFSLVFTGFLVNVNSIPAWCRWIHYLSIFYYAFEAMITNELSGLVFTFQATGSAEIPNVLGSVFLETLGFKPNQTTTDIGVLVGIYFLMVLLALGLFFLRLPRQRTPAAPWWRRKAAGEAPAPAAAAKDAKLT